MNALGLTDLERLIEHFSLDEQLLLLERLAARVRRTVGAKQHILEADLAAMAADPDIQKELGLIGG
jgi:hypothetical protein